MGLVDPHSEQQLARVFLLFRHRRGSCEVRGGSANLWYAAAKALGFDIGTIRCPDQLLIRQVSVLCAVVKSLVPLSGRLRPPQHLPDIIFSNLAGIPLGPDLGEYWGAWLTPHLFFYNGTNDSVATVAGPETVVPPAPLRGWTSRSVHLNHGDTGGSTSGRGTFEVCYPPCRPWVEPLEGEPQGGTPLLCCVNDRVPARPFLGPCHSGVAGECVVREEGLVLNFGLFPASEPDAWVLLESSGSPSGYGLRTLSARELDDLWDVPILFMDSLSDPEVGELMAAICRSLPSKLLHSGANLLLTSCFRGGLGVMQGHKGSLLGPRPLLDTDLGLAPAAKCLQSTTADLDALAVEEYVAAEEVIKGDLQKTDNAAVPDHLWLRAFDLGYGESGHSAWHLRALGRTEGSVGFLDDPAPPRGWRGALPGLRLFALRYWRSRVTRGYVAWRRANVPLPAG